MAGVVHSLWICEIIAVVTSTSWVFGSINSVFSFFPRVFYLNAVSPQIASSILTSRNMELPLTDTDGLDASQGYLQDKL